MSKHKKVGHSENFVLNLLRRVKNHPKLKKPIKATLDHIGSLQFSERAVGFLVFFLVQVLIIKLYVDYGIGTLDLAALLHLPQRFPLLILVIFLVFFFISKYKIMKLRKIDPFSFKRFLKFFSLNVISFVSFFMLNKYMATNSVSVFQDKVPFLIVWYILGVSLTIFLVLAFFRIKYLYNLFLDFKGSVLTSLGIGVVFLYTYPFFYKLWPFFSKLVAVSVFYMLKWTFGTVQLPDHNIPRIILPNFKAQIAAQCSGIEGMTLFILLFTIVMIVDWKYINKFRLVPLYIIGAAGMLAINILRVYALFAIGEAYSVELAVGLFHSNAGWILFTVYFLVFEYLSYDWLRTKKLSKHLHTSKS